LLNFVQENKKSLESNNYIERTKTMVELQQK